MTPVIRTVALAAVVMATCLTASARQQAPAMRPGAISGTVIDGATGGPIAGAIVAIAARPGTELPPDHQSRQFTDAKGRFVFLNLPEKGEFQISAAKSGFLDGGYGREAAPTDPLSTISFTSGAWIGGLKVTLWPPSSISGTLRDENGEPVVGVFVRVLARIRIGGREELAAGPNTVTDDRGQYRISGLMPGRYVVHVPSPQMTMPSTTRIFGATANVPEGAIDVDDSTRLVIGRYPLPPPPVNGRPMTYPAAFHPSGSTPADAATVDLKFGDERTAIDIALTPAPAVRVNGIVDGPPDALTNLNLRLLPAGMENLGLGADAATALVAADGTFSFANVPPGSYTLDAPLTFNQFTISSGPSMTGGTVGSRGGSINLPPPPPRSGWSSTGQNVDTVPGLGLQSHDFRGATGGKVAKYTARMPLTVGAGDMNGVVVRLRPNGVVRGRVIVDADPGKPGNVPAIPLSLDPAAGRPGLVGTRAVARPPQTPDFEITGVQPGEYFLRVFSGGAWAVKSIEWRGRDYTTSPIDAMNVDDISGVNVTVTNRVASLGGSVRAIAGATPESSVVVVFPAQAAQWQNTGLWSPRFSLASVTNTGTYRLGSLPAGDYCVAAIDRSKVSGWRDPAFLSDLSRLASRVTLDWGQTSVQDVAVAVIK